MDLMPYIPVPCPYAIPYPYALPPCSTLGHTLCRTLCPMPTSLPYSTPLPCPYAIPYPNALLYAIPYSYALHYAIPYPPYAMPLCLTLPLCPILFREMQTLETQAAPMFERGDGHLCLLLLATDSYTQIVTTMET
eukprot:1149234-Pelagomonas_calceolata.AAC.8